MSIAAAIETWLDPTTGIATDILKGKSTLPLDAGVQSTPAEATVIVS